MKIFIKIINCVLLLLMFGCSANEEKKTKLNINFLQAKNMFRRHDFIESAKLLSKIISEYPKFAEARILLSKCFFALGNSDRGIDELYLTLNNKSPTIKKETMLLMSYITLMSPHISEKNQKTILDAGEMFLKENYKKTRYVKIINKNLFELKQMNDIYFAAKMAKNLIEEKNPEQALTTYRKILKIYPNYISILHNQGTVFLSLGKTEEALKNWNKILEINPYYIKMNFNFKLPEMH